jgi:hypothetical protein
MLPERERRGSRARCILLTNGSDETVARRLSALAAPFAVIDPNRHYWMPRGCAKPKEARLGDALSFLSEEHRETITHWWLAVREHANTPNWDIASTATIDGTEGLVLVEAKAHAAEIKTEGKFVRRPCAESNSENKSPRRRSENHSRNHGHIDTACREAGAALNRVLPGWTLSVKTHYQLCNRFAWTWKIATLGVPVVLIYLGFLGAEEMCDQGIPLADAETWERLVRDHSQGVVPAAVWDQSIFIEGIPVRALIRSMELSLDSTAAS